MFDSIVTIEKWTSIVVYFVSVLFPLVGKTNLIIILMFANFPKALLSLLRAINS